MSLETSNLAGIKAILEEGKTIHILRNSALCFKK